MRCNVAGDNGLLLVPLSRTSEVNIACTLPTVNSESGTSTQPWLQIVTDVLGVDPTRRVAQLPHLSRYAFAASAAARVRNPPRRG